MHAHLCSLGQEAVPDYELLRAALGSWDAAPAAAPAPCRPAAASQPPSGTAQPAAHSPAAQHAVHDPAEARQPAAGEPSHLPTQSPFSPSASSFSPAAHALQLRPPAQPSDGLPQQAQPVLAPAGPANLQLPTLKTSLSCTGADGPPTAPGSLASTAAVQAGVTENGPQQLHQPPLPDTSGQDPALPAACRSAHQQDRAGLGARRQTPAEGAGRDAGSGGGLAAEQHLFQQLQDGSQIPGSSPASVVEPGVAGEPVRRAVLVLVCIAMGCWLPGCYLSPTPLPTASGPCCGCTAGCQAAGWQEYRMFWHTFGAAKLLCAAISLFPLS